MSERLRLIRGMVDDLRRHGGSVAATNGCFDVLHAGHIRSLGQAAALADFLVVLVNADESVRRLKGETRPIQPLAERMEMLRAIRAVDLVLPFYEEHCGAELKAIAPDVYAKSEEYRGHQHPAEEEALEACGTRVGWLPRDPRYSTTDLIQRIAAAEKHTHSGDVSARALP